MTEMFVSSSGELDSSWLGSKLGKEVESAKLCDMEKLGGMSGAAFRFVDVSFSNGEKAVVAVKSQDKNENKAQLGCPREAFFYNELAPQLADAGVPRSFFAEGDMATGTMLILMECLADAVPAGVFFGPSNPNNWAIKDNLEAMCNGNPTAKQVSLDAFKLYARLHGTFWGSTDVLRHSWLRGSDWMQGSGEASWLGAQKLASDAWASLMAAREAGTSPIQWDEHLVACLSSAFSKVSWETFQADAKTRPMTLVQGDCHPHNALWTNQRSSSARLRLIDFEMVGVGSGPQELGQFLISHMPPAQRRECERDLVRAYHEELLALLRTRRNAAASSSSAGGEDPEAYTLDACWEEYVAGGAGRWAWFVAYLGVAMPAPMAQFFHDQTAAFLRDHVPDPTKMVMPRV